MEAIVRVFGVIFAVAVLALGVVLAWFPQDAPVRKLSRVVTVEERCLVCNDAATRLVNYGELFKLPHAFCHRHDPPPEIWYYIWPEIDKYIFIISSLIVLGAGIAAAARGALAALKGEFSALLVVALPAYGLAWLMNHATWYFNAG